MEYVCGICDRANNQETENLIVVAGGGLRYGTAILDNCPCAKYLHKYDFTFPIPLDETDYVERMLDGVDAEMHAHLEAIREGEEPAISTSMSQLEFSIMSYWADQYASFWDK